MASKYQSLPQGLSEAQFDAAVTAFRDALGADQVLTSAEHLHPYTKVMMAVPNESHAPAAVLLATTVEQVQAVVRICNQHRVPVWTNRPSSWAAHCAPMWNHTGVFALAAWPSR